MGLGGVGKVWVRVEEGEEECVEVRAGEEEGERAVGLGGSGGGRGSRVVECVEEVEDVLLKDEEDELGWEGGW